MNASILRRAASIAAMSFVLTGCGGLQTPAAPRAVSGSVPAAGSTGDLIYATGYSQTSGSKVFMFSYPQGKLVGSIAASAQGMCADSNGNVYLLYRNAAIEYAHAGTTPIRTLRIPGAETEACAVDSTTNDVAVTFFCPPCDYENLAIFPNGSGTSTRYSAPNAYSCTYDDQGNLFLSGGGGSSISELPRGSNAFTTIDLSKALGSAGQLQWDGQYVTLQTLESPSGIYQIQVSGSVGTVVSETKFGRYMRRIGYSWIAASDGAVIVPFSEHSNQTHMLGIWKYPSGGKATKIIKKIGSGDEGFGFVVVSIAPSR